MKKKSPLPKGEEHGEHAEAEGVAERLAVISLGQRTTSPQPGFAYDEYDRDGDGGEVSQPAGDPRPVPGHQREAEQRRGRVRGAHDDPDRAEGPDGATGPEHDRREEADPDRHSGERLAVEVAHVGGGHASRDQQQEEASEHHCVQPGAEEEEVATRLRAKQNEVVVPEPGIAVAEQLAQPPHRGREQ